MIDKQKLSTLDQKMPGHQWAEVQILPPENAISVGDNGNRTYSGAETGKQELLGRDLAVRERVKVVCP